MRSATVSDIILVSSIIFIRIMYVCSITRSVVLCFITMFYACVLSCGDTCFCNITCQYLLCLCVLYSYYIIYSRCIGYYILSHYSPQCCILCYVTCCYVMFCCMSCSNLLFCIVLYYHSIMSFVVGSYITLFHIVLCTYY